MRPRAASTQAPLSLLRTGCELGAGSMAGVARVLPGGGVCSQVSKPVLGSHTLALLCVLGQVVSPLGPSFLIQRMEPMMTQPPLWVMVECSEAGEAVVRVVMGRSRSWGKNVSHPQCSS